MAGKTNGGLTLGQWAEKTYQSAAKETKAAPKADSTKKESQNTSNPVITAMGKAIGEALGTGKNSSGTGSREQNSGQKTGSSLLGKAAGLKLGQWGADQSAPLTNRALTGNNQEKEKSTSPVLSGGGGTFLGGGGNWGTQAKQTEESITDLTRGIGKAQAGSDKNPLTGSAGKISGFALTGGDGGSRPGQEGSVREAGQDLTRQDRAPGANAFGGSDWSWEQKETPKPRTKATIGAPSAARTTSWTGAGDNLHALQDLGNEIEKASFFGEEPDEDLVNEYISQSGRYFVRPERYTAENVGDYIDRVYYLAMTPGPDQDEKQEIREIMDVIAPSGSMKNLFNTKESYHGRLAAEDQKQAGEVTQIYYMLRNRLRDDSWLNTFGTGAARGMGVTSVMDAERALVNEILERQAENGNPEAAEAARGMNEYAEGLKLGEAYARENDSFGYGAGRLAGGLLLMKGLGGAIGGPIAAATEGSTAVAKLAGLGKVGKVIAKYLPGAAGSAATFGTMSAVENLGAVANGEMSPGSYLTGMGISAGAGAAGSAAAQGMAALGLKVLSKPLIHTGDINEYTGEEVMKTLANNRIARAIVSGLTGVAFAGGDSAVREISSNLQYGEDYRTDWIGLIENALISGAFAAFHGWARTPAGSEKGWTEGEANQGAGTVQENPQAREFYEKYFGDCKTAAEAKRRYNQYVKEHSAVFSNTSTILSEAEEAAKIEMGNINDAYAYYKSYIMPARAAEAGEEARTAKAEAESKGDAKAAAKADAEMKDAVRLLNEYAADPDIAQTLPQEAREALEILNAVTEGEASAAGSEPAEAETPAAETPKKGGRTPEEKAAADKRMYDQERESVKALDPETQTWLKEKYDAIKDQLDALNVGDSIYNSEGEDVARVISKSENGMTIGYLDEDGEEYTYERIPKGTLTADTKLPAFTDPETERLWTPSKSEGLQPEAQPEEDGIKFSISKEWTQELERWLEETKKNPDLRATAPGYFRIGTTADVLKMLGVRDTPVFWRKYKIGEILEDHPEITPDILKQVPDMIENPAFVMKSLTRDDSLTIIGELKADNGDNVMAAMELTPKSGGNTEAEFSLLTTAHARAKNRIKHLLNESEMLYINPEMLRTGTWSMQLRVQFPSRQPPSGSVGSVTYGENGVNISGKKLAELGGTVVDYDEKTGLQLGAQQEGETNETIRQEAAETESGIPGTEADRNGQGEPAGRTGALNLGGAGTDAGAALTLGGGEAAADGGEGRITGERTGGQAGKLDEDTEPGRGTGGTDRAGRNAAGKSLGDAVRERGIEPVSTKDFGIENGTDSATVYPVPKEMLPKDLSDRIYGAELATGCSVEFFAGPLELVGDDGTVYHADGFVDLDNMKIAVQVDGDYEPWQVLKHEIFHAYADRDEWLVPRIRGRILEQYGRKELAEIVKGYIRRRRGLHNMESGPIDLLSRDAEEILEEIFADASGMMNKFGLGAQRYFGQVATELNNGTLHRRDSARKTTAGTKFSFNFLTEPKVPTGRKVNADNYIEERHGLLIDDIRQRLDDVRNMEPVKTLKGTEFQKNEEDGRSLRKKVEEYFDTIGSVYRKELGDIALNGAGARDSTGHGYGPLKAAAFAAVPDVIREGKMYGPLDNNQHDYDTFLFIAPVTFEGSTGGEFYVGAYVIRDEKTLRYKLHEVLTIEKEDTPRFQKGSAQGAGSLREVSTDHSITDDHKESKQNFSVADSENDERSGPVSNYKAGQMRALEESGNVPEEYAGWFADPEDIYTFAEALDDPAYDHERYRNDFTRTQAVYALRDGSMTVYSIGELRPGTFVTPSREEALEHADGEELRSTTVPLETVAWMSPFAGLYTGEIPVENLSAPEYNNYTPYDQPNWSADETALEEHHWPENFPQVMFQTNTSALKNSGNRELHAKAKNGDRQSAWTLVQKLIKPDRMQAFADQYKGALVVPVRGEGAGSKNQIPYAYAAALKEDYGMKLDNSIIQVQKAGHTSAEGIHRLMAHSVFDGEVIPGQDYVLLDDVMTFGGTLNDLRDYIESNGGHVVACTVLAVGRNGSYLAVQPKTVEEIYSKFGKEEINNLLREAGIAYDAESLTDRQARYIQNTDLFTLRDRIDAEKASGGYRGGVSYTPREPGERTAKEILEERAASGRPQRKRKVFFSVSEDEPSLFDGEAPAGTEIRGVRYGKKDHTMNNKERVGITYAFAPLSSLTASNAPDGSINPNYPQELQPRDRTRLESLRQVMDMANHLIPERLEKNPDVQNGALLVRGDGVIISGNGRSMALSMAYDQGKADEYVRYLKDHASEWGLNPDDVPEDRPVLVRVADEGQDWEQLSRDANVSTIASKSDSETARTDAKNLKRHPEVLDKLIPDEDGELNTKANSAFISDFTNKIVPEAERGEVKFNDGLLTQRGLKRVQHAIFELAYEDASLLERLSERLDNDMKNVTNALLAAASQVVAYENAVDKGERYDVGLRQLIKDAVELYRSAKEKGETVAQRTANLGFDEDVKDWVIYIARFIEKNKGSGKQLREFFGDICESSDEMGDPNQVGFFEDETEDKNIETVLKGAIKKYEDATGRTLPKPERWGAGTLEELQETTGLSGKQLEDYYLRDESGVGAQPDGRSEGEREEEPAGSDGLNLTSGIGEDGREGSDLGRERDGGRGSGSGRDDGGRIPDVVEGPLEEEPEETGGLTLGSTEEKTGAERKLEQRRKDQRASERNREKNKHQRTQFPDYNPVPEDAGRDFREIAEEIRSKAAAERAKRLEHISKKDFFGTESLQKLGVKIEGALGNYQNTKQLREIERAAFQLKKTIRKREKELNATDKEKQMANGLAAGIFTMEDFGPNVNKAKIEELADYYELERTINEDMILERRRQITGQLADQMREMLPDDPGYRIPPMFVMNHRTPERICRQIFGDEKGKEVYEKIFRPVAVNEAEKIRFINKQFNDVREITGRDGKRSELTKEERMLVQQMIEGQAAAELVAGMELEDGRERIENAAQNIVNGTAAGDAAQEHGLDDYERGVAEQYARWLQTKAIYDSGDFDTVKVDNAVKIYKEKYNQFYDAINDFLVAHGYKPIGFIKGYAPHMQMEEDLNVFAGYLKSLGINEDVTRLPANIAGQTAGYKPNKRWNPFFLTRSGNAADFDIAKGFQSYVTFMADVLYHTDDIMRVRAMSRHYKETYAPEEIRENLSWARNMNGAAPEVKREQLQARGILSRDEAVSDEEANERFDKWIEEQFNDIQNTTKYSDLVMYLDNYANILAGKQSMSDRGGEYDWGRESLTKANRMVSAFARTQVAGNLSSAVTQFSQIPMITAELGPKYVLQAIGDFATGKLKRGSWAQESDHLTERAGSGALVTDRFSMVMEKLFTPLRMIDGFTATIAVRAKYLQQIEQGRSHEEAMREADAYAKRVQGSRAKGSKPLAFHSKKLWNQMLHMFQLELFNSWEHVSQDIPADFREIERTQGKGKAAMALAMVILKYLVAAFILNRTTEELTGGTPAPFDLLGLTSNFIASGYGLTTNRYLMTAIDNAMEKMWDKRIFETDPKRMREEFDWEDAISGAGYEVGNDIPYLRNILGLLGLGDQTLPLPLMGAGDDLKYLWKDIKGDFEKGQLSGQTGMDLLRVMNQLYPGGRQVTKTAEGIQLMAQGGRYINGQLYYPVENTIGNWAKALLFGRSALEETNAYYAGDDRKLSVGSTELYQMLTDEGSAERREAYEALQGARSLNEDQTAFLQKYAEDGGDPWPLWQSMQQYKEADNDKTLGSCEKGKRSRAAITEADLTDEERLELYRVMDKGNEGRADKLEAIMEAGVSWAEAVKTFDAYAAAEANENLSGYLRGKRIREAVTRADMTDEQRLNTYRALDKDNEGKADKLEAIMKSGLSWADAAKAYDAYAEIEADDSLSKNEKAEQWASWVNHQDYSADQKKAIRDSIKFWGSYAIEDTSVDKLSGAGLDADNTDKVAELLDGLEPEPGRDKVTDLQKYTAIAGSDLSVDDQWKAIIGITPESYTSTLDKITIMQDYGIEPSVWTESKQAMYDADDAGNNNDSTDQKEATAALDGMNIPNEQKAILWQLTNKSWSWKKNPYDTDIGQEVYALMHEGDAGKSTSTKKKSGGGRRGGGGGRRGGSRTGTLQLGEIQDTGNRGIFDQILAGWKRRKYSRAAILAMVRQGILTQEEADRILATAQEVEEEIDGSLQLGSAEEMSA